jgi:hypothetical protein
VSISPCRDFPRDLHLQAELAARTPESTNARVFEPGEAELPVAADLISAIRRGRWTFRLTAGAEAGGHAAHAPLHTDAAILTRFTGEGQLGLFGIEMRADWAREAPLVIAPEVVAATGSVGLPFTLSLALPVNVGASGTDPSYGVFFRLMILSGRESGYARGE